MSTFTIAAESNEAESSSAGSVILTVVPMGFVLLLFFLFLGTLRKARNTQMQWFEQSMRHMARLEEIHARGVATLEAIQRDMQRSDQPRGARDEGGIS